MVRSAGPFRWEAMTAAVGEAAPPADARRTRCLAPKHWKPPPFPRAFPRAVAPKPVRCPTRLASGPGIACAGPLHGVGRGLTARDPPHRAARTSLSRRGSRCEPSSTARTSWSWRDAWRKRGTKPGEWTCPRWSPWTGAAPAAVRCAAAALAPDAGGAPERLLQRALHAVPAGRYPARGIGAGVPIASSRGMRSCARRLAPRRRAPSSGCCTAFHLRSVDLRTYSRKGFGTRRHCSWRRRRRACPSTWSRPVRVATLLRLSASECRLALVMHHLTVDGLHHGDVPPGVAWVLQGGPRGRGPRAAPVPLHYGDAAVWQQGPRYQEAIAPHLASEASLAGAPVLALPTQRPTPSGPELPGWQARRVNPRELLDAAKTLGRREDSTLFMTLLSAFGALLHSNTMVEVGGRTATPGVDRELPGAGAGRAGADGGVPGASLFAFGGVSGGGGGPGRRPHRGGTWTTFRAARLPEPLGNRRSRRGAQRASRRRSSRSP